MATEPSEADAASRQADHHTDRNAEQQVETQNTLPLTDDDYVRLAHFRHTVRQLSRQTELEARKLGLAPQQYQLMVAIKGFPGREWANISELAERLQIRHNAVIGLVNRAEARGLVVRRQDADRLDRRVVQIHLTPLGERALQVMAAALHAERTRVREALDALVHESDPSA
ncbi:MAG: MarR family winged helix-turn-helix transcriptional regulator [Ktedonobacterales bacterium]